MVGLEHAGGLCEVVERSVRTGQKMSSSTSWWWTIPAEKALNQRASAGDGPSRSTASARATASWRMDRCMSRKICELLGLHRLIGDRGLGHFGSPLRWVGWSATPCAPALGTVLWAAPSRFHERRADDLVMAAGSPTTMTRVLTSADGGLVTVVLEDLAGDDGGPLGSAVVELPPGRAGRLVELSGSALLTGRLLQGCADHLRAIGRLRLTASCDAQRRASSTASHAAGFRPVREDAGRVDLILEL